VTASCRIDVYVQPRASKSAVVGTHEHGIRIRIAAPAVENAANEALIAFVADELGIARRCVRIVSGLTSRRKRLEIWGLSREAVLAALLGEV
jgi:uncharacterized protein